MLLHFGSFSAKCKRNKIKSNANAWMRMFTVRHMKTRTKKSIIVCLSCCNNRPSVLYSLVWKRSSKQHTIEFNVFWMVSFCWMNRTMLPHTNHTLWFSWCLDSGHSECGKQLCIITGVVVSLNLRCSFNWYGNIRLSNIIFIICVLCTISWTWFFLIFNGLCRSDFNIFKKFCFISLMNRVFKIRNNNDEIRNQILLIFYCESEINNKNWLGSFENILEIRNRFKSSSIQLDSIVFYYRKNFDLHSNIDKVFIVIRSRVCQNVHKQNKKYLNMQSFISHWVAFLFETIKELFPFSIRTNSNWNLNGRNGATTG